MCWGQRPTPGAERVSSCFWIRSHQQAEAARWQPLEKGKSKLCLERNGFRLLFVEAAGSLCLRLCMCVRGSVCVCVSE